MGSRFLADGAGGLPQPLGTTASPVFQDLTLNGDLRATNATIENTLEVKEIIADLKVRDPLIETGIDNPADNINLGFFSKYMNAMAMYPGLVRSFTDGRYYLLDSDTAITPTLNITGLARANLTLNQMTADDISVDVLTVNNSVPANQFTMPLTRGTAAQVLTSAGDGTTSWQNAAAGNPFDQSLNTNDNVSFQNIAVNNISGAQIAVNNDVPANTYILPLTRGTNGQVLTSDGAGASTWEDAGGFDQSLNTTDNVQFNQCGLTDNLEFTSGNVEMKTLINDQLYIGRAFPPASIALFGTGGSAVNSNLEASDLKTLTGVIDMDKAGNAEYSMTVNGTAPSTSWALNHDTTPNLLQVNTSGTLTVRNDFSVNGNEASFGTTTSGFTLDLISSGVGAQCELELISVGIDNLAFGRKANSANFTIRNISSGNNLLTIPPDGGGIVVGDGVNSYALPADRGTSNYYLRTDGAGGTAWAPAANPFDQSLNVADSVQFARLTIGTGGSTYTMPINPGPPDSVLTMDFFGGNAIWQAPFGNVNSPSFSTDNAVVRFQGGTGKFIQTSACSIDDLGVLTANEVKTVGVVEVNSGSGNSYLLPATRPAIGQVLEAVDGVGGLAWTDVAKREDKYFPLAWGGSVGVQSTRWLQYNGRSNVSSFGVGTNISGNYYNAQALYIIGCSVIRENSSSSTVFTVEVENGAGSGVFDSYQMLEILAGEATQVKREWFDQALINQLLIPDGRRLRIKVLGSAANPQECSCTIFLSNNPTPVGVPFAATTSNDMTGGPAELDAIQELQAIVENTTNVVIQSPL